LTERIQTQNNIITQINYASHYKRKLSELKEITTDFELGDNKANSKGDFCKQLKRKIKDRLNRVNALIEKAVVKEVPIEEEMKTRERISPSKILQETELISEPVQIVSPVQTSKTVDKKSREDIIKEMVKQLSKEEKELESIDLTKLFVKELLSEDFPDEKKPIEKKVSRETREEQKETVRIVERKEEEAKPQFDSIEKVIQNIQTIKQQSRIENKLKGLTIRLASCTGLSI
jgi:hypothetical protein